ncbi:MAG: response regulator transcription factor [Leptospiraceae bacterium]|nr:response regulator transcription factor [Leptospiraceae bacterium]MCP5513763.1 response regulator transcription factor [Leptospiraceae bacterium]
MNKIKILVVDDHSVVSMGLKFTFEADPRFSFSGICSSFKSLLEFLERDTIDIILLDLKLPDVNDLDSVPLLREKYPNIKIIVFTMHEGRHYYTKALSYKVDAYLIKSELISNLPDIVSGVFRGFFYSSLQLPKNPEREYRKDLKPIEIQIVKMLEKGLFYEDIAKEINKSPKTIEYHLQKLKKEFNVKNNIELISKLNLIYFN